MCGVKGQGPLRSLGDLKGAILSRERMAPLCRTPCGYAGEKHASLSRCITRSGTLPQPPHPRSDTAARPWRKTSHSLVAFDVPSQTPHCLGSVFVIALPAEAADLVQRFHVSPKPQCHRAVDDLRVRIVLFRVRRNFLVTEDDWVFHISGAFSANAVGTPRPIYPPSAVTL